MEPPHFKVRVVGPEDDRRLYRPLQVAAESVKRNDKEEDTENVATTTLIRNYEKEERTRMESGKNQ